MFSFLSLEYNYQSKEKGATNPLELSGHREVVSDCEALSDK